MELKLIEKIIKKIIEINCCTKSNDKKHLIQDLKIQVVFGLDKVNIQKGKIKIKTFIIIYLKEYVKIKLTNPAEDVNFKIPLKDRKLNSVSTVIQVFNSVIRVEKQISFEYKFSPIALIEDEIIELIYINFSHIKNELLIKILTNKILNTNLKGFSILLLI